MIKGIEFHDIINNVFDGDVHNLNESEQLQVNCPRCQERDGLLYPDGKYNLEINTAKRVFRCWKCDEPKFSGSLGRLIKLYGSKTDYELYKSYSSIYSEYDYNNEEKIYDKVYLPKDFISFSKMDVNNELHLEAYNYLILDRKISREKILKYRLGFCLDGKYKYRIIIPSFDINGDINYFVSRGYRKEIKPKYLNPKVDKSLFIFNEGYINWDDTIYLVEGVFDMLSLPNNAIPLLGKTIFDLLFEKIKYHKPNIIILLDPDAFKSALSLFYMLFNIYIEDEDKVKFVEIKGDLDINDIYIQKNNDGVAEILKTARTLTINDYFINNLTTNDKRYRVNQQYFRR